ncbi:MAG: hypoxanthine phosphoribosyltransferase, partial [Myxococcales bacterium]|nr:hypoxanthine phosphoribosyltransferase [Myxococcales bacterium]
MPFYDPAKIEVLIDAPSLAARISALGAQITADYGPGTELVLVGVLKGSYVFLADLARAIDLPVEIDFLGLSSYGSSQETSGVVQMTQDLTRPVKGKHVLVVEDIVDTGLT